MCDDIYISADISAFILKRAGRENMPPVDISISYEPEKGTSWLILVDIFIKVTCYTTPWSQPTTRNHCGRGCIWNQRGSSISFSKTVWIFWPFMFYLNKIHVDKLTPTFWSCKQYSIAIKHISLKISSVQPKARVNIATTY